MVANVKKYLFDILDSIQIIESHVANTPTLETYEADRKTADSVERRLSIIGEALNKAVALVPDLNISNKNDIIKLRHLLVHHYDIVDDETIWRILKEPFPVLKVKWSHCFRKQKMQIEQLSSNNGFTGNQK